MTLLGRFGAGQLFRKLIDRHGLDVAVDFITHAMSGAFDLSVPLAVNLSHGASWAAAKG